MLYADDFLFLSRMAKPAAKKIDHRTKPRKSAKRLRFGFYKKAHEHGFVHPIFNPDGKSTV